ncbi:polyketide cyclase /reductase [Kitasatospora xanthocidica]|uniref:Polyketide cyclase /reductase n=1 Tax=Kitasatospora xanthocidica TaxID=83382 RepID=A0A372ZQD8_9ACTN|nr:SRPBCC family protein [Kitasatospora xanthocidica]RGD57702.1 polyketide cyclase /reductase [Kitasatospora xanthocidica]
MSATRSSTRGTGIRTALLTLPLALGLLGAAAAPAGAATAHRPGSSLTCGGAGVDPDAPVRHRTEAVIHAPLRTVWRLQTDVARWPDWQAPVRSAERLDGGPLRPGSAFHWTTPLPPNPASADPVLEITSTVRQLRPGACIRWTGPAVATGLRIDGVHVWNFTEVPGGVLVRTEETHTGPQVDANVPAATDILRQGLEGWLHDLKTAAEARTR